MVFDSDSTVKDKEGALFNEEMLETSKELNDLGDQAENKIGLTVWEAGIAFVGSIIGGGIVGIPYAMLNTGIPLGIVLNLIVMAINLFSGFLYLRLMKMSTIYVESVYEIGYVSIGKVAIYLISLT